MLSFDRAHRSVVTDASCWLPHILLRSLIREASGRFMHFLSLVQKSDAASFPLTNVKVLNMFHYNHMMSYFQNKVCGKMSKCVWPTGLLSQSIVGFLFRSWRSIRDRVKQSEKSMIYYIASYRYRLMAMIYYIVIIKPTGLPTGLSIKAKLISHYNSVHRAETSETKAPSAIIKLEKRTSSWYPVSLLCLTKLFRRLGWKTRCTQYGYQNRQHISTGRFAILNLLRTCMELGKYITT